MPLSCTEISGRYFISILIDACNDCDKKIYIEREIHIYSYKFFAKYEIYSFY